MPKKLFLIGFFSPVKGWGVYFPHCLEALISPIYLVMGDKITNVCSGIVNTILNGHRTIFFSASFKARIDFIKHIIFRAFIDCQKDITFLTQLN